ncbi:MAG TPA: hypothetical protein VLD63_07730 [Anaerolineales bacterium]|nr:hypothetical protein [Anaerolineales bacterium]
MAELTLTTFLTLDVVMQAPAARTKTPVAASPRRRLVPHTDDE